MFSTAKLHFFLDTAKYFFRRQQKRGSCEPLSCSIENFCKIMLFFQLPMVEGAGDLAEVAALGVAAGVDVGRQGP